MARCRAILGAVTLPVASTATLGHAGSSTVLTGILCVLAGAAALSVNDLVIKGLSGGYALHQILLIRTLIGLAILVPAVAMTGAGLHQLRTRRPGAHLVRVSLVMVSNAGFFLGLAALPIAEAVAIAFVSPLVLTAMSVVMLGEKVGPRRWAAVIVGLAGVIVMLRPGADVFQPAALLVLISAFTYAATNLMTRQMRETESAFTLNFYTFMGFLVVSTIVGLAVGDGRFAGSADASMAFLLRGWLWPAAMDWPILAVCAVSVLAGGLLTAQAYRLGEAALIAPFEYAAMPLAVFWGISVFGTWPDRTALIGITLVCGAGLYALRRERIRNIEEPL